jgi:hypothetical protein
MLAIFVLSVLAASIVLTSRSETFASYNYRIAMEADYVAKAGLQKAINYFNSDKYKPVPVESAASIYEVHPYASSPVLLEATIARPVRCIDSTHCPEANRPVTLQMDSDGDFDGNYPTNLEVTETDGSTVTVATAFRNRFFNVPLDPLSSATNSGQFTLRATLLEYYTVNDAFYPTLNRKPYEVWLVESHAEWNSNAGAGAAKPTSVQQATLAPVYLPYFANALYGMCNITLQGQVCTDSYHSGSGSYNAANPANCVTAAGVASNALASGAGVGSGGRVTLNGSAYVVNGDVSYGASPPSYSAPWVCASPSEGVVGSVAGVKGSVQPVPAIPQPPMPTFPPCAWYGTAGTNCNNLPLPYRTPPNPTSVSQNNEYVWVRNTGGRWVYEASISGVTTQYPLTADTFPGWAASTLYTSGSVIREVANDGAVHLYVSQNAGSSGGTKPAFPASSGATVSEPANYPTWQAVTSYAQGALVIASPDNGHLYRNRSAGVGVSGAAQPAWPTAAGATVNDGAGATRITWEEVGSSAGLTWVEGGLASVNPFGSGTDTDPFRLPAISVGTNANVCLAGGSSSSSAIYYAIADINSGGKMYIVDGTNPPTACPPPSGYNRFGYAVVNVYRTLTMTGQGLTQPASAPPSSLIINVYNSGSNSGTSVRLSGQANIKAVITALGDATLGGGGTGGAFYGSILAGSITDSGTYAVHYDRSLQVLSGKLMPMAIRNYNRPKF